MPVRVEAGRNLVDEEVLLSWWRSKTVANPVHPYRVRRMLRDDTPGSNVSRG